MLAKSSALLALVLDRPVNLNLKYLRSEVLLMSKVGRIRLEVKKAPEQAV